MTFNKWLDTLVDEKGLDLEHTFTVDGGDWGTNWIPLGVVLEFLKGCSAEVKADAKTKLVLVDFNNGDVMHFFNFVAKWMAG